ncbi:hypothetical protein BJX64DRAFT_273127 [Aspergillus heterothallicus]
MHGVILSFCLFYSFSCLCDSKCIEGLIVPGTDEKGAGIFVPVYWPAPTSREAERRWEGHKRLMNMWMLHDVLCLLGIYLCVLGEMTDE